MRGGGNLKKAKLPFILYWEKAEVVLFSLKLNF